MPESGKQLLVMLKVPPALSVAVGLNWACGAGRSLSLSRLARGLKPAFSLLPAPLPLCSEKELWFSIVDVLLILLG